MAWQLKQLSTPAAEPLTLDEAKSHLRVDVADDDTLIESYIVAARSACESFIHGYLITQQWQIMFDAFPNEDAPITLPAEPLVSIDSVSYIDYTNLTTNMVAGTDYLADTDSSPGRLVLPPNVNWPGQTLWPVNPIKVNVTVGFGASGISVPEGYRQGMRMLIAHWYENRETVETSGAVGKEIPMSTEYAWWAAGRFWHGF